jgi:hypothetical protein
VTPSISHHSLQCTFDQIFFSDEPDTAKVSESNKTAGYCLTLPGKTLFLTPLLSQKKFRSYGNKDGAVKAFFQLEEEGLGKTHIVGNSKANPVRFVYGSYVPKI